jgi:hypothetical protein
MSARVEHPHSTSTGRLGKRASRVAGNCGALKDTEATEIGRDSQRPRGNAFEGSKV